MCHPEISEDLIQQQYSSFGIGFLFVTEKSLIQKIGPGAPVVSRVTYYGGIIAVYHTSTGIILYICT